MTKDDLIAQLAFELYEAKQRLEKISELASEEVSTVTLEISNICSCRNAWEDAL